MTISVSLVGTRKAQVVVSATTLGSEWTLLGIGGGMVWPVPGGHGVGDGSQLVLVDNRAPLNVPVSYTYTDSAGSQTSDPATFVEASGDAVIELLDGTVSAVVNLQNGSQDWEMAIATAFYRVPGRRNPVSRFAAAGGISGVLTLRSPQTETAVLAQLFASGQPLLVRHTSEVMDLPLVMVIGVRSLPSRAWLVDPRREWSVEYVALDDPWRDRRLGAYTWDEIELILAGRSWDQIDVLMSGYTWDQVDALDWSTL